MERKEVIEVVKKNWPDSGYSQLTEALETLIPELKENEDEKIRKWCISHFRECFRVTKDNVEYQEYLNNKVIPWLERQGEKNPADKGEPKFKTGTYVVYLNDTYMLEDDGKHYILTAIKKNSSTPVVHIPYGDEDYTMRKWTIHDAKEGDVLRIRNLTFIFQEITNNNVCHKDAVVAYCSYEDNDDGFGVCGPDCITDLKIITPATKEQCDLLFQKMKEAGYEWDADKKELKKVEQKSADKVIKEEKPLLEKFKQAVYDCAWGKVTCKKEGETKEEYANRWAEHFLLIVRDWADDYIDFTIQQKLRNSYEKGKANIIETLHEQKSAWSEWDEKIYNLLYEEYKNLAYYSHSREKAEDIPGEVLGWLKSLKNRVLPQSKQEWSEEDKERYISCLQRLGTGNPEQPETINSKWFKEHVYPQTTWKPSEAQLASLTIACDRNDRIGFDLTQLLRDLKKLK